MPAPPRSNRPDLHRPPRSPRGAGRLRAPALALALLLGVTGCALRPPEPPRPAPPTSTPVPVSTPTVPTAPIASWGVEHLTEVTAGRQLRAQWPRVPGEDALTAELAGWSRARAEAFTATRRPDAASPPELRTGWEVLLDGGVVGVRLNAYEVVGRRDSLASSTLYADRGSQALWRSADLIAPEHREAARDAVVAALRASGQRDEGGTTTERDGLLNDVSFTPSGDLVVVVAETLDLPERFHPAPVTIGAAAADAWLSDAGRTVQAAWRAAGPRPVEGPGPTASGPGGPVDCAARACVALTFDDGPGADTWRLLDLLAERQVHATFFVLGRAAAVNPEVVRRTVAEGHEVGNHSWSHPSFPSLPGAAKRTQIDRTAAALAGTGAAPRLFRPPYGAFDAGTRALGLPVILWDVDTLDWKHRNPATSARIALRDTRPGSIILLHDIHPTSVDAVPAIIDGLQARGFAFVTVSQLLESPEPGQVYKRR